MSKCYKLEGREVVPSTPEEWASWVSYENRRVADTTVGKFWVSTVFVGLPHTVFETMVFNNTKDMDWTSYYSARCYTYDQAEDMHRRAVAWAGCCAPYLVSLRKEAQDNG